MAVESAAIGGLNPEQENEVTPILSLNQDGYSLWRNAVTVSKNRGQYFMAEGVTEHSRK
jgi:hypothetical protein